MAGKKGGLGKGLDSLIPGSFIQEEATQDNTKRKEETLLKISEIEPNREQPRKEFNEDALEELADSIREVGVLQPLIVQKEEDFYKIIAGERRWRAAKKAGLKEIPVIIKEYTPQQILEISLIENIQRENLNVIEEAIAYKKLLEEFHLKQDEIAERVSKSRVVITNALRLLKLDPRVQDFIKNDMISAGHGRALLMIEDQEQQYNLAIRIIDEKLSVRDTEHLVKIILQPKKEKVKEEFSETEANIFHEMEEKMKSIIGSKVVINKKSKDKGKIEIEYYSGEELERILELFENMG